MRRVLCAGWVSGYDWRQQTEWVQLMAFLENDTQRKGARAFVQAWRFPARGGRIALVSLICVSGCSNYHQKGPEAWYHEEVGGAISAQRPPPPGLNDPFPNLATVPAKPAPADAAAWNKITAGLMTDRVNARQAAALAPIPTTASAAPNPEKQVPQPQGAATGASAAFVGASPPPAPPGKAKAAPTAHAAPAFGASPSNRPAPILSSSAAAARVANGQLPALPTREPSRPNIAPGPPPPLVPVTATPPAVAPPPSGADTVDFSRGSAALNDAALADVKTIAAARGDRGIAITGYGDTTTSDASGQSDALGLGFSRAQALAVALVAQGVPYARLRLNAESAGRGASLRLLQ
jgi:outer membrane protein OmpA-like peptidoglycan-associated protein